MADAVETILSDLQIDCDKQECDMEVDPVASDGARQKLELKVSQLLSELIDTERNYVQDLQQVDLALYILLIVSVKCWKVSIMIKGTCLHILKVS